MSSAVVSCWRATLPCCSGPLGRRIICINPAARRVNRSGPLPLPTRPQKMAHVYLVVFITNKNTFIVMQKDQRTMQEKRSVVTVSAAPPIFPGTTGNAQLDGVLSSH